MYEIKSKEKVFGIKDVTHKKGDGIMRFLMPWGIGFG